MHGRNTGRITVLIADDHPVVRNGLKKMLEGEPDITVVGEASDGYQAEHEALRLKPDVIIMDIYMPRRGGLPSMVNIKEQLPKMKFLIITMSPKEEDRADAMRLGAAAYLKKTARVDEVLDAVRRVAAGVTAAQAEAGLTTHPGFPAGITLTLREEEVLQMLGREFSNEQIAERFSIGSSTVKTYIHRLQHKLGLQTRAALVRFASDRRSKA